MKSIKAKIYTSTIYASEIIVENGSVLVNDIPSFIEQGKLSKAKAKKLIKEKFDGEFIIRDIEINCLTYIISFEDFMKYAHPVNVIDSEDNDNEE